MLRMLLYAPIIGIGGIYKVLKTGAHMEWIIVMAVLVISGLVMVLMSITLPKFKIMQKLVDALNLVSREILTGLSVIRAFGREKKEEERRKKRKREKRGRSKAGKTKRAKKGQKEGKRKRKTENEQNGKNISSPQPRALCRFFPVQKKTGRVLMPRPV